MEINLIGFDVVLGRQKPENIVNSGATCPFCDVANLRNIIDTDGDIIFLANKYNVLQGADQFVIIEGRECDADMPSYTTEHMRRVIRFGFKHWQNLLSDPQYEAVLFFKNFGPLSGGTIRHPHMQIVGFPQLNPRLLFTPQEFDGITIHEANGVKMSVSTCPRVGFGELNILPDGRSDLDTVADFIQIAVDYLMHHFSRRMSSYNIFFYHEPDKTGRFFVKIMSRFATSPLFIGYNIHFLPNNLDQMVREMKELYFG